MCGDTFLGEKKDKVIKILLCQLPNRSHRDLTTSQIISVDLQEVGRGCGDWMELAKDRDSWWALVSTVMNFGVP